MGRTGETMEVLQVTDRTPEPLGPCVAVLGSFDGVHIGHQRLFAWARAEAAALRARTVAVTFWPHPRWVIKGLDPGLLYGLEERLTHLASLCVDIALVFDFTREFAAQSPSAFINHCLKGSMDIQHLLVGYNFTFGRGREGTADWLREQALVLGFPVTVMPAVRHQDQVVSSTRVRHAIAAADFPLAHTLLGRPYVFTAPVERGDGIGSKLLGFPTINMATTHRAVVAEGVYAARVHGINDRVYRGAVSVGANPTFGQKPPRIETHILDFDGDLYGQRLGIEFVRRLRGMMTFSGPEALKEQIAADVRQVRDVLR